MREALALIRSSALSAASYRVGMVMSLVSLSAVVVPLYFIARALQPVMAEAISGEAQQYFAFVVLGAMVFSLVSASTTTLPTAIEASIGRGTLEMMLATPARLPALVAGLMGYGILWASLRAVIVVIVAVVLGAPLAWSGIPAGVGILALTMLAYAGVGLVLAASVLVFRTSGPIGAIVLTGSMFLGGVYYPTRVIPGWMQHAGEALPLTHGLRALRQVVLRGAGIDTVATDLVTLTVAAVTLLAVGALLFVAALRRARHEGTLSTY